MLRFGTGSENSINATGNLQQPFYRADDGAWRKLTFSNYPLDFEIMEGGDGTNWWNRSGVSLYNPVLQNQTFDYSGYVQTLGGGYGIIVTSGTLMINGKLALITHEYVLPQDKFLIQITTTIQNLSDAPMTNLRYWVGTRDDYIGNSDSNHKTKGNIIDGRFEAISHQSEQSKALLIYNNNEGVLFYTNSDQANTIVGSRFGWQNIQSRNPVDTPIEVFGDNAYAFYVRFDDLAPQAEARLNWYYAAGTRTNLDQIIQDVYDSVQLSDHITNTSIQFEINEPRNTTTYYVVLPGSEGEPTQEQIMLGQNADGSEAQIFGSVSTIANVPTLIEVSSLSPGTRYTIYIVIVYSDDEVVMVNPIEFETTNRYTISFDSAGGSEVASITQDAGTALTPPTPPTRMGYTFVGWEPALPEVMGNEDQHLSALWQVNSYVFTFNGRKGLEHDTVLVEFNTLVEPITPSRLGYTFGGWYKEVSLSTLWNFEVDTMPAESVMVYARWIANSDTPYTVEHWVQNIHDDEYTLWVSEQHVGVTHSVVNAVALEHVGLIENMDLCERIEAGIIEPDGSLVLRLYYDRREFTVVFKDFDDSLIDSHTVRYGSMLSYPTGLNRDGFTFIGWDHDGVVVSSDLVLSAQYLFNPIVEANVLDVTLEAVIEGLDDAIDFSDEERREEVRIILELSVYDDFTLPLDSDVLNDFIENTLNLSNARSMIMDISLFKVVGESYTQLTHSQNEITISFVVPPQFHDQDFMLIHIHEGEASLLEFEYDAQTHVLTFVTRRFSTFALAFEPTQDLPNTSDPSPWAWIWLLSLMGGLLLIQSTKRKNTLQ